MITNDGKNRLLNLMGGNSFSAIASTNRLPEPSFDDTKITNFIGDIETKLSITGFSIIDIIAYKDYKIVYGNANNKGVIGLFDLDNNLIETINKVDDYTGSTTSTIDLDEIKIMQVNKSGFLYGLSTDGTNTFFFRFSDLLEQVGILAFADIDVFYTARINMSVETPKDPTKPTEDIMGASIFNDYEKVGMANDFKDVEVYAFALWKSADKKIRVVQISVPNGSITQESLDWKHNEDMIVGSGNIPSEFSDISELGLLTGNYVSKSETILGSIMVESSKTSLAETWNTGSAQFARYFGSYQRDVFLKGTPLGWNMRDHEVSFSHEFDFDQIVNTVSSYYSSNTLLRNPKVKFKINLNSYVQDSSNVVVELDEATSALVLANNNLRVIYEGYVFYSQIEDRRPRRDYQKIIIKSGTTVIAEQNVDLIYEQYKFFAFYPDKILHWNIQSFVSASIVHEEKTSSSARATTQLISFNEKDNGAGKYEVKQALVNIYKGSKPVFLNEIRCYTPLYGRDDGRFNIYEFTPLSDTKTEIDKVYIDHTPSTQPDGADYYIDLQDLSDGDISKVVRIEVDSIPVDRARLSRTGNRIKIENMFKDKEIVITYKSFIPSPKKLLLDISTDSDDVWITGINNQDELNTTSDDLSIVGVGDDGTRDFGFTLYSNNSNTELNSIAENVQTSNINMKHVVAARQNDILFIYGYNQDFTKEMKWISIYSQSLHPYTFESHPYVSPQSLNLERLNGADTSDIKDSRFDKIFDNVSFSSGTIIANTSAKISDFNYDGNVTMTIYGSSNNPLFTETVAYSKTRQEVKNIYMNINTRVIDKTNVPEIIRNEATATMSEAFVNKNNGYDQQIIASKLKITFSDGSTHFEDVSEKIFVENEKLKLETAIKRGTKTISKIEWFNTKGDLLAETSTICDFEFIKVSWEVIINSSSSNDNSGSTGGTGDGGGTNPPTTHEWGVGKWGESKWQ